jgi:membrane protease YdiL (CAAX protease family)
MMLLWFFALTFAISWGGILLVVGGPAGFTGATARTDPRFPHVYLAMLAGPVLSGMLFTAITSGALGFRELGSRLRRWRVDARAYAVALLTAPLVVLTAVFILSLGSPGFVPGLVENGGRSSLLLFGLAVGLGAGLFEELGWTGFAVPQLRRRYGILKSGLILGVLWAAWHVVASIWGMGDIAGAMPLPLFLGIDLLSVLLPYRVLMVWMHERTNSLLVTMLMHASLTSSLLILGPVGLSGTSQIAYDLGMAAILWVSVAAVFVRRSVSLRAAPAHRP